MALAIPVAQAARGIKNHLQENRGGLPVEFGSLAPCLDPVYAHSLYRDPSALDNRIERLRRSAQWIVTFCAGDVPQLSVSVSTLATDISREGNKVRFPISAGGEFWIRGIPPEWEGGIPVSAATAATLASEATGRTVVGVPELLAPPFGIVPQAAQWRVRLEPIGGGSTNSQGVGEVFVGMRLDGVPARGKDGVQVQVIDNADAADAGPTGFRTSVRWDRQTRSSVLSTNGRN